MPINHFTSFSGFPVRPTSRRYPLTALEVASGYVLGKDPQAAPLPNNVREAPITTFEEEVREALLHPPCGVAFSGGRDSSAVLAVAATVARRDGLPLPIPITLRFPESAESDESEWQEHLVRHLELEDWLRLEFTHELDCVGPVATAGLRRHGLLWPANAHFLIPPLESVSGGALLTGDGGDFAFETQRWAARLLALLQRQARPTPRDVLRLGFVLSPPRIRSAVLQWSHPQPVTCTWLQPDALRAIGVALRSDMARAPLRLDARVDWSWRLRPVQMGLAALDLLAADARVTLVHPFNAPRFRASLMRAARRERRFADRTEVMRWLFSDVLPDDVCARPTKGTFGDVFWNRHSRAFAEEWDGEGADSELVNVDVLRELWRSPEARKHFRSCTQLQAAWLVRHARRNGSDGDRVEQPASRLVD